jgi:hypothetical protein
MVRQVAVATLPRRAPHRGPGLILFGDAGSPPAPRAFVLISRETRARRVRT